MFGRVVPTCRAVFDTQPTHVPHPPGSSGIQTFGAPPPCISQSLRPVAEHGEGNRPHPVGWFFGQSAYAPAFCRIFPLTCSQSTCSPAHPQHTPPFPLQPLLQTPSCCSRSTSPSSHALPTLIPLPNPSPCPPVRPNPAHQRPNSEATLLPRWLLALLVPHSTAFPVSSAQHQGAWQGGRRRGLGS